jgi:hypothetical protein
MRRVPEYLLILYTLTGTISIAVSQAAMGLGAVAALVDRGRRTVLRRPDTRLEWPLLAWTAAAILATLFASDPVASAEKLKRVALFGMVFWAPAVIRTPWNLGRLFMGLLFSAGVSSLYGVLTFFLQGDPELGTRIRGFHGFYLTNSGLLLLCTFPAAAFATCPVIRSSHRWGASIALVSILTVQLFGLLPGAWIGTLAGFLFFAWRRRNGLVATAVGVALLAIVAVPGALRETAVATFDPGSASNAERWRVAGNGLALLADDPATGWGLHDLRDEYVRVKAPGDPIHGHMGSVPIQVAASMGLPGLLALGWLVVAIFRRLGTARRQAGEDPFLRAVVDGTEAGFVAFLAAGLVEWNLGDSEIVALLFFLVGTAIAAGEIPRPGAAAETR